MKKLVIAFVLMFPVVLWAQYDSLYAKKFNLVRECMGSGHTGRAYFILQDLYKQDSSNHYINYLMGVCYTEQYIVTEESIRHLEYATKNIMDIYTFIPYYEKRAPVFAWFYLTKAYAQNGYCEKAKWSAREFQNAYGSQRKDYFNVTVESFTAECVDLSWSKDKKRKGNIVTKDVSYTTDAPLYGVQVGAFRELVPVREEFDDLKNVEAFLDKDGVLRYVVGHLTFKSQAESLLRVIKEHGYKDAFIVDVNREKRFSNEVVIVDNISFKAHLRGRVDFRVQVGAYRDRDSIPNELVMLYLQLDDLLHTPDGELTAVTTGSFMSYQEATEHKKKVLEMGIPGCFVVAYNDGRKVAVKSALKYLERQERERQGQLTELK